MTSAPLHSTLRLNHQVTSQDRITGLAASLEHGPRFTLARIKYGRLLGGEHSTLQPIYLAGRSLLLLLPQYPTQAIGEVVGSRDLTLGHVAKLVLCQASDDSTHVRNEFRARSRSFDREGDSACAATHSGNFR